ncbi:HAMP domain-containing sensor histidine kinase [Ornithinibacillus halotolerans]|uniref:histidine kinase n=1 Tax=Ornithinibacillus halotolerans TaxID=1274357 RepID=A0A916WC46_9BACI|nr:HAMP domain-containing sensor histidine kinase [Ornithinibacillus halotolerans]GGA84365.1 sensor histidine kinase YkoH [Ornithinibacillus halotolerans]
MKLRTKIQLFTSIFMLVLILFINTSIYILFYKNSVNTELEELNEQAISVVKVLKDNPNIPPKELLKAFVPADGMIKVFPETGKPLHEEAKKREYFGLPGRFTNTEYREIITYQDSPFAIVTKPIISSDGEIVTLQISRQLIALEENMKTLFYVLVIASIITLIPTVIAGNLLARFLLQPIKALINTMRENMKFGKWNKITLDNRSQDELHEMEKTFNEMIDYQKENYEMQEIFVSDASHELKTPISIIKSYAQLLERRGTENPSIVKESLDAINSEAERMQKLVEQMLALAKNKDVSNVENINITNLLEETIAIFKGAYGREINFYPASKGYEIQGNQDQLKQVFYILIDNALKYSDKNVDVTVEIKDDNLVIFVRDYGQGIPDEEKDRLFERFYRMDKARNRNTGGTGLGLAIAKTITTSHGGSLSVESVLGEGSTFIVALPLK